MEVGFKKIELLPEEELLFAKIEFTVDRLKEAVEANYNAKLVVQLVDMLLNRKVIPPQRLRYFNDPELCPSGRGKSLKQVFEGNGTRGSQIFEHPHFLPILNYWVCGAKLDDVIRHAFWSAVKKCGGVTSGDVATLAELASRLAKEHGLENYAAQEEFYKLALDCCVSPRYAADIGKAIR